MEEEEEEAESPARLKMSVLQAWFGRFESSSGLPELPEILGLRIFPEGTPCEVDLRICKSARCRGVHRTTTKQMKGLDRLNPPCCTFLVAGATPLLNA